jgi:adenylate cyclase
MDQDTKEIPRKKEEIKLARQDDDVNNPILDKMMKDVDANSVNPKLKEELIDLEKLFKQRQGRLLSALRERYQYDTSVRHSQEFLLKHVNSKMSLVIMYADLVGSTQIA